MIIWISFGYFGIWDFRNFWGRGDAEQRYDTAGTEDGTRGKKEDVTAGEWQLMSAERGRSASLC